MIVGLDDLCRDDAVRGFRMLEQELFGTHAWSEAAIRQELDAPGRTYVFDLDGEPVPGRPPVIRGFAGYWYDGDDAEIMDIGVGRAYQRHGIAGAMLTALIDAAHRQGARRMLLEVSVENAPAIALYERFGFSRIGLRRRYYQPEGIDAHVMALELGERIVGFRASDGAGA